MEDHTLITTNFTPSIAIGAVSQFRQEYLECQELLLAQPPLVQRYLETNAASLAEAIMRDSLQVRFSLPDRVELQHAGVDRKTMLVPPEYRDHMIGGLMDRLIRTDLRTVLRSRLLELEHSTNKAVSISAILLRHAVVIHMVHDMLPSGKSVQYTSSDGDEIPSIPLRNELAEGSAIMATTDAIGAHEGRGEVIRGELLVPYVEAARQFYLPQWVAFDDNNSLLVGDLNEAKANIVSMQRYLSILHAAVGTAPYMVADDEYQRKRYGIMGQLVNQGRALASYQVEEIIRSIQHRAAAHDLDRGLSLSLPYFNDQTLVMDEYNFDVIPVGRVMFVPAFIVLAVRAQGAKVAQDTRLNHSTRRHLLSELAKLEQTFLR